MKSQVPEGVNEPLENRRIKVQTVNHNDRKRILEVVHKTGIQTDNACKDKQKRGVDADLLMQRARHLVFPHHVEVRLQATEGENERDEKTHGANEPELADRHVFGVLHDGDNRVDRPVEIQE